MSDLNPEMQRLMDLAVERGASDILLSVGAVPTLRISGVLTPLVDEFPPLVPEVAQAMILPLMTDAQLAKLEEEREFDFSYAESSGKGRFRVNVFYQRGYLSAALRLIPSEVATLRDLNLPVILERFTRATQGLFLITGPAGHGKTTTLASLLDIINTTRAEHIITIEDPIEFIFTNKKSLIEQREVHRDTLTFANALVAVLRQDPNVVLIGEMRDLPTIEAALTIAETGHLVFASIHTNNAAQAADRIISVFPSAQQQQVRTVLANVLLGVVSQRLIPRADGKGRVPAVEIMTATPAVKNLIREGKTHLLPNTIATSTEEGMISMDRALAELVKRGEISYESAEAWATDPKTLAKLIY